MFAPVCRLTARFERVVCSQHVPRTATLRGSAWHAEMRGGAAKPKRALTADEAGTMIWATTSPSRRGMPAAAPLSDDHAEAGNDAPNTKRTRRETDRFQPCPVSSVVGTSPPEPGPTSDGVSDPELAPLSEPQPLTFSERMVKHQAAKVAARVKRAAHLNAGGAGSSLDRLATMEAQPEITAEALGWSKGRYVAESARRPVYQARVVLRDSTHVECAEADAQAVGSLTIDSSEMKSPFYLETLEQRLVEVGAAQTSVIERPADRLQPQRTAAFVQLNDRAHTAGWQRDEERSKVWIEYLSTQDLDQGMVVASGSARGAGRVLRASDSTGGPWFGEALALGWVELRKLARSFHTRGQKVAKKSKDKFETDAVSIEFGYSVFPGGAKIQMHARKNGIAYERKATAIGRDMALGKLVEQAAPLAWDFVVRRYPNISREMLREVGRYGMYSTGFSKVTIAYDNPTCVHYDSNFGADVILAFRLRALKGGEHVMLSVDGGEAIVVETSELGTLIGGC